MTDNAGEQLTTILSLERSCLWILSGDKYSYCLNHFEYASFVFDFYCTFLCLLLLFIAKCNLTDIV